MSTSNQKPIKTACSNCLVSNINIRVHCIYNIAFSHYIKIHGFDYIPCLVYHLNYLHYISYLYYVYLYVRKLRNVNKYCIYCT